MEAFSHRIGGSSPSRDWEFFLHHCVQTGFGAYPAFCTMGTSGSFPGGKAAGCEADHSLPSSVEVKN